MITQNRGKQLIPVSPVLPVISFRFWSADCPWLYVATTPAEGKICTWDLVKKGMEDQGKKLVLAKQWGWKLGKGRIWPWFPPGQFPETK